MNNDPTQNPTRRFPKSREEDTTNNPPNPPANAEKTTPKWAKTTDTIRRTAPPTRPNHPPNSCPEVTSAPACTAVTPRKRNQPKGREKNKVDNGEQTAGNTRTSETLRNKNNAEQANQKAQVEAGHTCNLHERHRKTATRIMMNCPSQHDTNTRMNHRNEVPEPSCLNEATDATKRKQKDPQSGSKESGENKIKIKAQDTGPVRSIKERIK